MSGGSILGDSVGDRLDALVPQLRDMYEAIRKIVDAYEGAERLDPRDGAAVDGPQLRQAPRRRWAPRWPLWHSWVFGGRCVVGGSNGN